MVSITTTDFDPIPAINAALSRVADPEIPAVTIVDLGIVRGVTREAVSLTPTYMGCPATLFIEQSVRRALDEAGNLSDPVERTVIDPPP